MSIHSERLVEIHKQLWQERPPQYIMHQGRPHEVHAVNDISRDFRNVWIDDRLIITQNLAKHSQNTRWCMESPENQMTWVIADDTYIGRIKSYIGEQGHVFEVWRLDVVPEKLVYQKEEPL